VIQPMQASLSAYPLPINKLLTNITTAMNRDLVLLIRIGAINPFFVIEAFICIGHIEKVARPGIQIWVRLGCTPAPPATTIDLGVSFVGRSSRYLCYQEWLKTAKTSKQPLTSLLPSDVFTFLVVTKSAVSVDLKLCPRCWRRST
jgi:hypothetical protein